MGRPRIVRPEGWVRPKPIRKGFTSNVVKTGGRVLSPQQERMALNLAAGMIQANAYRDAYKPGPDRSKNGIYTAAYSAGRNPKVVARVAELREKLIDQTRYGMEQAMQEAEEARQYAMASAKGAAAAVSAVTLKARLQGLLVEDRQNAREALSGMSDEELRQLKDEATAVIERARAGT